MKTNLLRNRVKVGGSEPTSTETDIQTTTNLSGGGNRSAINLLIMILAPVGLYGYGFYMSNQYGIELSAKQEELSGLTAKATELETKANEVKTLETKLTELQNNLTALKKISSLRTREIRVLDFVQSVIPERVWLNNMRLSGGSMEVNGLATGEEEVGEFVQRLGSQNFFEEVKLIQSSQEQTQNSRSRSFQISARFKDAK